jgi:hypothetical protein
VLPPGHDVDFVGFHVSRLQQPLPLTAFTTLAPNQSVTVALDVTRSFDVFGSSPCTVSAQGDILTLPRGASFEHPVQHHQLEPVPYSTPELHIWLNNALSDELRIHDIEGIQLGKRAARKDSTACTSSQFADIEAAFSRAQTLAAYARDQLRQHKNTARYRSLILSEPDFCLASMDQC